MEPVFGKEQKKAGRVSIRERVAIARKSQNETGTSLTDTGIEAPKSDISVWRKDVEPGGDHLSDVSEPVSKVGKSPHAMSVHPTDSASCAASPDSSVLSSANRKGPHPTVPPASHVGSSSAMSVVIEPPTPRKNEKVQRRTTLEVSTS